MLSLNLNPIFQARGINKPYTFLVKAGFTPHTATSLTTSNVSTIKLQHIELLCKALVCEPNDLFLFNPNNNEQLNPTHPLFKLQQPDNFQNWHETIANIPFKQLKEISNQISNK